jgi:hypothetical protein
MLSARSFSSGCFIGSVLTPVGILSPSAGRARRRIVDVFDALGRAAVALQLRLDPVDCRAIAIGALPAIAELRQAFDRRSVSFEVEPFDQRLHRIGRGRGLHAGE